MKAYCPNCGTPNETTGGRVVCSACTTGFEASSGPVVPPPLNAPPKPTSAPLPPPQAQSPQRPVATWGANQTAASVAQSRLQTAVTSGGATNPLAIVSLVAGIVCCIPIISPAVAIATGVMALQQIDASSPAQGGKPLAVAGIVLGGLTLLMNVLGLIGRLVSPN